MFNQKCFNFFRYYSAASSIIFYPFPANMFFLRKFRQEDEKPAAVTRSEQVQLKGDTTKGNKRRGGGGKKSDKVADENANWHYEENLGWFWVGDQMGQEIAKGEKPKRKAKAKASPKNPPKRKPAQKNQPKRKPAQRERFKRGQLANLITMMTRRMQARDEKRNRKVKEKRGKGRRPSNQSPAHRQTRRSKGMRFWIFFCRWKMWKMKMLKLLWKRCSPTTVLTVLIAHRISIGSEKE